MAEIKDMRASTAGEAAAKAESRNREIIRTSMIGAGANLFLAIFKAVIGVITGSIAIVLDAVNNVADAAASVITIVGAKLAGKEADKEHPFGYGRVEYLSAMVIAILVLYAGITSLVESIRAIMDPKVPAYTTVSLVIVAVAVLVKILLGRYVKSVGQRINSDSLIDSGQDSILDSIISASTLLAALLYVLADVSLEAWLGAIISLVIIKSGFDMLKETLSKLLGERMDADLAGQIVETVKGCSEDISGVYDLVLNNYGPDTYNGSLHIAIPDTYRAKDIDRLTRKITEAVFVKYNVLLTAISVYSVNTQDDQAAQIEQQIRDYVKTEPYVLEMHGFYLDEERKRLRFDLVISLDAPDRRQICDKLEEHIQALYPDYTVILLMDTKYGEK